MKTTYRPARTAAVRLGWPALGGGLAMLGLVPAIVGLLGDVAGLTGNPASARPTGFPNARFDVIDFAESPVIGVQEARALIAAGALVLDARADFVRDSDPLPNAQPVTGIDPALDDRELTDRLRSLGVSRAQAVVVVDDVLDDAGGSGADEIVATLRDLGHARAVAAEGGLPALRAAGFFAVYPPAGPGDFTVRR